jgi:hypothetical protein
MRAALRICASSFFLYAFFSVPAFRRFKSVVFCAAVPVYPLIPFAVAIFVRFEYEESTPTAISASTIELEEPVYFG